MAYEDRNTSQQACNYDQLVAGSVYLMDNVKIAASQTIKRGDILECAVSEAYATAESSATVTRTVGTTFAKAAGAADIKNIYVIAAHDVKTESSDNDTYASVYVMGEFNRNKIGFGGSSNAEQNKMVLMAKGILLRDPMSGKVTAQGV